ncbi:MAG: hypothetical protein JNL32_10110 [Candidatus Kapabacteria bacterium]|nr:hypothetical protein [Candidatus Kapabacteria bacterium]
MKTIVAVVLVTSFMLMSSCKESVTDPNVLGGETNLDLTKPGNEVGAYLGIDGIGVPIEDSIFIVSNNNGIVTTRGWVQLNQASFRKLDTAFGTTALPVSVKYMLISAVLGPGTRVDTSVAGSVRFHIELKSRVTSEGIQDFRYSNGNESKPFMLVRYSDPVGTVYSFTDSTGRTIQRTVTLKAEKEDWSLGFLQVKSIRVDESVVDNPAYSKITYITNHKFGFIGTLVTMKNGRVFNLSFIPWAVV